MKLKLIILLSGIILFSVFLINVRATTVYTVTLNESNEGVLNSLNGGNSNIYLAPSIALIFIIIGIIYLFYRERNKGKQSNNSYFNF